MINSQSFRKSHYCPICNPIKIAKGLNGPLDPGFAAATLPALRHPSRKASRQAGSSHTPIDRPSRPNSGNSESKSATAKAGSTAIVDGISAQKTLLPIFVPAAATASECWMGKPALRGRPENATQKLYHNKALFLNNYSAITPSGVILPKKYIVKNAGLKPVQS